MLQSRKIQKLMNGQIQFKCITNSQDANQIKTQSPIREGEMLPGRQWTVDPGQKQPPFYFLKTQIQRRK